ncbi:MAG TPA: hypothetical protein VGM10_34650 [Actinocrinis sp.]|jgi:hypothetical protein
MPERYPIGSTIPVQPWLTDGLQKIVDRDRARETSLYLVQRFQSWRVYPVRVGRWYRWNYVDEGDSFNDALGGAMWLGKAAIGGGHWKPLPEVLQLLDPATGQPIAEHLVMWPSPLTGPKAFPAPETRSIAVIGDPRVCGLFTVFGDQDPPTVAFGHNRHAKSGGIWKPEDIEKQAAKLAGKPYKDFASKEDGPWIVDHPEPPAGGKTRWSRYKPGG